MQRPVAITAAATTATVMTMTPVRLDEKLPATMKCSNNKQANVKQEVATHKELLATVPLSSADTSASAI
eukprot:12622742-Ditylum_brightwellii.AAC.1